MSWMTQPIPWFEAGIMSALIGALVISRVRDPLRAWRWGLIFTGITLASSVFACVAFYGGHGAEPAAPWSFQRWFLGQEFFEMDELNAPLIPMIALLHFLTALTTGRTKMRRFSLSWSLISEAIRLATFGCISPWLLIGLLTACVIPAYVELVNRGKPTRIYLLHMGLFAALMILGWIGIYPDAEHGSPTGWATCALLAAILIRCGIVPVHCWLTDWFEHASFGNALLFVTPLTGVYACLRLVLPTAPDWVLGIIGALSLITALYAAGMAVVQKDARRFFAYLFLSHVSLVLVGLELHTAISLTGSLALWISASLSLTGLGLTLRALEARYGRLSLESFHGLYEHSPSLAICFLLTGLANVGFPGTLGFVAGELLVDGAVQASLFVGFVVAITTAINGIAVIRVYFCIFTGKRHASTVSLGITPRERFAVLTLAALILGGGIFPQPGIASRYRAAILVLQERIDKASHSVVVARERAKK